MINKIRFSCQGMTKLKSRLCLVSQSFLINKFPKRVETQVKHTKSKTLTLLIPDWKGQIKSSYQKKGKEKTEKEEIWPMEQASDHMAENGNNKEYALLLGMYLILKEENDDL